MDYLVIDYSPTLPAKYVFLLHPGLKQICWTLSTVTDGGEAPASCFLFGPTLSRILPETLRSKPLGSRVSLTG